MKLKEFLRNVAEDEWLYIGAASAFVCICQKKDVEKQLEEKGEYYFDFYREKKRLTEVRIENHPKIMKKYRDMLADAEKKGRKKEIKKAEAAIIKAENKYKSCCRDLPRLTDIVSGYKQFMDRKVKESYRRKHEEPKGMIITVEGPESGPYWFLSEVEG